jgi:hypothetical protein
MQHWADVIIHPDVIEFHKELKRKERDLKKTVEREKRETEKIAERERRKTESPEAKKSRLKLAREKKAIIKSQGKTRSKKHMIRLPPMQPVTKPEQKREAPISELLRLDIPSKKSRISGSDQVS